jgi:hypothetical protein
MATTWKPPLRLWTVGPDLVAATVPREALQILVDRGACDRETLEDELIEEFKGPDLTIRIEGEINRQPPAHPDLDFGLPESYEATARMRHKGGRWELLDGFVAVKATPAAWLATMAGPGILCSSEY